MAEVRLDLIYNDNGAQKAIDSIVNQLRQLETKSWKINLDYAPIRSMGIEFQKVESHIDQLKTKLNSIQSPFNGKFIAASFSDLESVLNKYEQRVVSARQELINFHITMQAKTNLGLVDEEDSDRLVKLQNNLKLAKEEAALAKAEMDKLGKDLDLSKVESQVVSLAEKMKHVTDVVSERMAFSFEQGVSQTGWDMKYLDPFEEAFINRTNKATEEIKEFGEEGEKSVERVSSSFTGLVAIIGAFSQAASVASSTINTIASLPGVEAISSLVDSLTGTVTGGITSKISEGFSGGIERFDILRSYPAVIENLGYSAEEAEKSLDRLYKSVLGLPTEFSEIVSNAQQFTLLLDDLERATDLAIAANNAFVASGSSSGQISAGMRQLQYLIEGTQLRSTQWYSLIRSMPIALREIGKNLGYINFPAFTQALREGKIETEELVDQLIDVGLHSQNLGNILTVMKARVQAALTNVGNAAKRMGENLASALDLALEEETGKGIAGHIKRVSSLIDHISVVAEDWIGENIDEISDLIDRFFELDWDTITTDVLDGLKNMVDYGLDFVETFDDFNLGHIITDAKELAEIISGISSTLESLFKLGLVGIGTKLIGGAVSGSGAGLSSAGLSSFGSGAAGLLKGGAKFIGIAALYEMIDWIYNTAKNEDSEYAKFLEQFESGKEINLQLADYRSKLRTISTSTDQNEINQAVWEANAIADSLAYYTQNAITIPVIFDPNDLQEQIDYIESVLADYIEKFGKYHYPDELIQGDVAGYWLNESSREFSGDVINLFDEMEYLYEIFDDASSNYMARLSEIEMRRERISKLIEDLEKEDIKYDIFTSGNYASIYGGKDGKNGKYLSEQAKDAYGGLYRNTLNDYIKVQQKFADDVKKVNDEMVDEIANYSGDIDKSVLYEAWSYIIESFDPNDENTLARLETIKKEGVGKILDSLVIPQSEANELNENNATILHSIREQLLHLALGETDEQEEQVMKEAEEDGIISEIGGKLTQLAEEMSGKYMPYIEKGLGEFKKDYINAIRDLVNSINSIPFVIAPNITYRQPDYRSPLVARGGQTAPYANGGFLPMGTDIIPAMLTPGEYVQRRAAVEHFGRTFMNRINALDLAGALRSLYITTPYATGGFVRSDNRSYRDNHAVVNQVFNSGNASTGFRRASRFVRALG